MRRLWPWAASCLLILLLVSPALAAPGRDEPKQASWVISYAIVFLGTGLGVAGVCRSARRSKKIRDVE